MPDSTNRPAARLRASALRAGGAAALALATTATAPVLSAGCGGENRPASAPTAPGGSRSEAIDHEPCDATGSNVEAIDTNGDGKPDIRRVFDGSPSSGGHEVCSVVDLNHDGRPDLYEYFDSSGAVRRRELCFDDSGAVNAIELYDKGKLVQRAYDTTGQHKIDTWDFFDPGAAVDAKTGRPAHPIRRERDTRGDGMITQWWTWTGDRVTIATDRNGDGKPDPESVIVLGDDAGAPASSTGETPAAASSAGDGGEGQATAADAGTTAEGGAP